MNNCLFIAPHPDDEVLGCGGVIKILAQKGANVFVLIVTRGKKEFYSDEQIDNVRNESLNAHKILGVTKTHFLDFPAPNLDRVPLAEISSSISELIKKLDIETIYLPHFGDIHHDHKVVFNAGMVASRPVLNNTVKKIFTYETLSETEWSSPIAETAFIPDRYVNISATFAYKIEAMKCYKSQIRDFPNPRSLKTIESLANFRGSTVGFTHAEAFMTIRVIED